MDLGVLAPVPVSLALLLLRRRHRFAHDRAEPLIAPTAKQNDLASTCPAGGGGDPAAVALRHFVDFALLWHVRFTCYAGPV